MCNGLMVEKETARRDKRYEGRDRNVQGHLEVSVTEDMNDKRTQGGFRQKL